MAQQLVSSVCNNKDVTVSLARSVHATLLLVVFVAVSALVFVLVVELVVGVQ